MEIEAAIMLRRQTGIVGLDLGSHSVKVVQLTRAKTGWKLVNLGLAILPPGAVVEGRVEQPERVAETAAKLVSHLKTKEKRVASSIAGYEVMIKKIELPSMSEQELESRLKEQLGQYVPYQLEEVNVDYEILGVARDKPNAMDVLLVAAKKESVNDYVGLIRLAGLEPAVIDVDFFALSNAFEVTYGVNLEENVALVDIGASKTGMTVLQGGAPVFTRDLPMGGNEITESIARGLSVPWDQAERLKLGEKAGEAAAGELEKIFVEAVRGWAGGLRRALDFYYTNYPDFAIHRILLSGGSARLPGLPEVLRLETKVPTEVFNPLVRLDYDADQFDPAYLEYIGPQMAICLGLGLRSDENP